MILYVQASWIVWGMQAEHYVNPEMNLYYGECVNSSTINILCDEVPDLPVQDFGTMQYSYVYIIK